MTERLYYRDAGLLSFDAVIVETWTDAVRFVTVLDRSAFYPTSGGQMYDQGTLNSVRIVEVNESPDGEVWHVTDEPVGAKGAVVRGEVDKERRRRCRQQHTAQHILSQSFIRLFGWETVSVHLGEEYGAIELEAGGVDDQSLAAAEEMASDLIAQNLPVEVLFVDSSSLGGTPLRKIPDREGVIRVIKIGDFDWSACGGTHCGTTAEVGLIKLTGTEKIRNRPLIRFLAGVQALADYRIRFAVTDQLSRALTCHVSDLAAKTEKLASEGRELRKQVTELHRELLPVRAATLAETATQHGAVRMVSTVQAGLDGATSSQLAQLVADRINGVALVLAEGRLVVAVQEGSGRHAGEIVKALAASLGLRGGGSNRVAQMGGAVADNMVEYEKQVAAILGNA